MAVEIVQALSSGLSLSLQAETASAPPTSASSAKDKIFPGERMRIESSLTSCGTSAALDIPHGAPRGAARWASRTGRLKGARLLRGALPSLLAATFLAGGAEGQQPRLSDTL